MNRIAAIATIIVCLLAGSALAQDDSTRYIFGLPVSEDDTARQFPANDKRPHNRLTPVDISALPKSLRNVLENEAQYKGWRDSTIYFQRNTGLYLVPIKYDEGVKVYGLSENGDPVTYDDVAR